jgi:hypothetical protein
LPCAFENQFADSAFAGMCGIEVEGLERDILAVINLDDANAANGQDSEQNKE